MFHNPNYANFDLGGKGIQSVSIGKEDLVVGRVYFSVEGTTSSCTFVIEAEAVYNCDPVATCSDNGDCRLNGSCDCFNDHDRGFWAGGHCDLCHPLYTGLDCKAPICSAEMTCNGNGFCTDERQCGCFNSTSSGFWAGERCNFCLSGYYGSECKDIIPTYDDHDDSFLIYLLVAVLGALLGVICHCAYACVMSLKSLKSIGTNQMELRHPLLRSGDGELV
ncbi:hypothetical protein GEMRC1_013153 [Eukaryota sp. GEM-RC1]